MSRAVRRFTRTSPNLPIVGSGFGVVQYRMIGLQENQLTINTFNYSSPVPAPTNAQLITLLANISANLFGPYQACVSAAWACNGEELNVVHRNDINGTFRNTNVGTTGSRGSPALSTEMAIVMVRESAVKGQHGRGRYSLPGVCAADTTSSRVTNAGLKTALAALEVASLLTASDGANVWTPCIAQRAVTSPRLVIGFSAVTTFFFDSLLGTIRRRKIGRGK